MRVRVLPPARMAKPKKNPDKWTRADFINEAARVIGDKDKTSEAVLCGAMMLAALRDGTSIFKLARTLKCEPKDIARFHDALTKSGVFIKPGNRHGGKVACEWFDEENGGVAFCLDVNVGLGLMERAP